MFFSGCLPKWLWNCADRGQGACEKKEEPIVLQKRLSLGRKNHQLERTMMSKSGYWADNYQNSRLSVEDAINKIKSGQRIFIGSSCGEPQRLVKGLADAGTTFTDLEIVRMFSGESTSLSRIAEKS